RVAAPWPAADPGVLRAPPGGRRLRGSASRWRQRPQRRGPAGGDERGRAHLLALDPIAAVGLGPVERAIPRGQHRADVGARLAAPTLTVAPTGWPQTVSVSAANVIRTRSATVVASASEPGSIAANSSPPKRATTSEERMLPAAVAAKVRNV